MRTFADFEKSHRRYVVCDFVCPTKATRENFDADFVVWMDTIKEGRFEDTNKLFQNPDKVDFHKIDLLILSPGISNDHKTVSLAKKYQCEIISDIELIKFISNEVFLIGITGTNGKSTTTKLVEHVLKENKKNSFSAGNIGIPISKLKLKQHILTYLIVEASSFQLERIIELKFNISVLLNISNDHIDRHKNISNYIAAKSNIFKNQSGNDFSIISIGKVKRSINMFKK